jgi:hypothetical protein
MKPTGGLSDLPWLGQRFCFKIQVSKRMKNDAPIVHKSSRTRPPVDAPKEPDHQRLGALAVFGWAECLVQIEERDFGVAEAALRW